MKKFYDKYSLLIILLLFVGCVFFAFKNCGGEIKPVSPVIPKLKADLKKEAEAKKEAIPTVSINTVYITKWKEVKIYAGKMPCDTALEYVIHFCDTIVQKDTLAINALKKVILAQDTVIKDFQVLVHNDSIQIKDLSKKLRRQKLKTKGIIALWLVREAVGVGAKVAR